MNWSQVLFYPILQQITRQNIADRVLIVNYCVKPGFCIPPPTPIAP